MERSNSISKIKSASITDTVIDQLTNAIIAREFKPGDQIPTEVELSEMFGVGRNAVREAIKVLVSYGVLEIRRAEGTFVCDKFNDKMMNPLLYGIILEQQSSADLFDLRRIIELGTTQTAIQRASDEDIARLEVALNNLLNLLELEELNAEDILQADVAFHRIIEEATHNALLLKLNNVVNALVYQSRKDSIQAIIETNQAAYLKNTHKNIYKMLHDRDMDAAVHVVDSSIQHWRFVMEKKKDIILDAE